MDEVIVLGHSLAEVDGKYFAEINKSIQENVRWIVALYKGEEKSGNLEDYDVRDSNISYVQYEEDTQVYKNIKKMVRYLAKMITYIGNNQAMIPNYGERYRYGEPISTAFMESTVNEVIAKRMAKKQQMQWSQEGAHYLLQTRVAVLNNELEGIFHRWYPKLSSTELDAMAA